jgi:hypothetical protein
MSCRRVVGRVVDRLVALLQAARCLAAVSALRPPRRQLLPQRERRHG